jgi:hypothetical protein
MIRALFLVLILTILGTIPSSANLVQMPTSTAPHVAAGAYPQGIP